MIQDKISIETRFQLDNTPENFKITDNTDYASESIATTDVTGILSITDPNGNKIHEGSFSSPDIDLDVSDFIDTIQLPKDSNGDILIGNYTITYTSRVVGAVQPGDYSNTFVYKYCYEPVDVDILMEVDLICAKIKSTDNTSYPSETTSSVRTHTIFPPSALDDTTWPDQLVATAVNTYSKDGEITTDTWTAKVSTVLELTYTDGLIVDVTVVGSAERDVKDDINICNLQCNMRALVERYYNALGTNTANSKRIFDEQLAPAITGAFMYNSNISCGNFGKAEEYYQDVLKYTGSQPDCQCSDSSTPQIIKATCTGGGGGGNTYVVDACGTNNALVVTSNTIGSETTYTVCFNQSLFDKLSALTETNIVSSDGSIVIGTTVNGYNKEYDLSRTLPKIVYYNEEKDVTLPATIALFTGATYTVPAGEGGLYEMHFNGYAINQSDAYIFAQLKLRINGSVYLGVDGTNTSLRHQVSATQPGIARNEALAMNWVLSNINLSAGDLVELIADGVGNDRILNSAFRLTKLT